MKVELDDLSLGASPLTGRIYVGIPDLETQQRGQDHIAGVWKHKREFTTDFVQALMAWCPPGTVRKLAEADDEGKVLRNIEISVALDGQAMADKLATANMLLAEARVALWGVLNVDRDEVDEQTAYQTAERLETWVVHNRPPRAPE